MAAFRDQYATSKLGSVSALTSMGTAMGRESGFHEVEGEEFARGGANPSVAKPIGDSENDVRKVDGKDRCRECGDGAKAHNL